MTDNNLEGHQSSAGKLYHKVFCSQPISVSLILPWEYRWSLSIQCPDFKVVATTCFILDQEDIHTNLSRMVLLDEMRSIFKQYSTLWSSLHVPNLFCLMQIFFFCHKNFRRGIHTTVCPSATTYFIKRTWIRTFRKSGLDLDLWKRGSVAKITCLAKSSFLTNSRGLV